MSNTRTAKISNFLFNDKLGEINNKGYNNSWGEKKLKFGWSSPQLKKHMNEPGNSPFSCPIPKHIMKLDEKYNLYYFKDYASIFKNEIEFREDTNNFKTILLELWEKELSYDFKISGISNLSGFSFFTDVHIIKETIKIIFVDMFKTKPEYPEIIIEKSSTFKDPGYHTIKITQKDSYINRDINDPKLKNPTGNLHQIIKNLKNLADYSIVGRFRDNKSYRINYLTSNSEKFISELSTDENIPGFTHEFKFYLL